MNSRSAVVFVRTFIGTMIDMSYLHLAAIYFSAIVGFGVAYVWLAMQFPENGPTIAAGSPLSMLLDSLYFSTVTATSVGFGDIVPLGFSRLLASIESLLALFVFGMIIAKSVAERQETAIYRMHKMAFEEIFQHVREGLFIVRRDLDAVMQETATDRSQSLKNLETALCYAHVLFEDIPAFYDTTLRLYTIDVRRERLLAEGVTRTLLRLETTLQVLKKSDRDIAKHKGVHEAFVELMEIVTRVLSAWKELASSPVSKELQSAEATVERIRMMA